MTDHVPLPDDAVRAHAAAGEVLLRGPLPADCLDAYAAAVPPAVGRAGLATLLATHPHRSEALLAAGYVPELPYDVARTLITRVPLSPAAAAHVVAVEAARPDERGRKLLAEVLFTAGPQLDDATLGALAGAAGAAPTCGNRADREHAAAAALGIAGVYPLTGRVRDYYTAEHAHAAARLTADRPAPPLHVPLSRLDRAGRAAAGPWLATRLGVDPAAWTVLAGVVGADPSLTGAVRAVQAVLAPAAGGPPPTTRRAPGRRRRTSRPTHLPPCLPGWLPGWLPGRLLRRVRSAGTGAPSRA